MPGKKGVDPFDPLDPPRGRANQRRGRGTLVNDRPPVLGPVGRPTGERRWRVGADTQPTPLRQPVEQFTGEGTPGYTDEYDRSNPIDRPRSMVAQGRKEWAREEDGDGSREVHPHTTEGLGSGLRTFLRVFRGVSKDFLSGYVAIHAFRVNLKRVTVAFISSLVRAHLFYP